MYRWIVYDNCHPIWQIIAERLLNQEAIIFNRTCDQRVDYDESSRDDYHLTKLWIKHNLGAIISKIKLTNVAYKYFPTKRGLKQWN
ncbi:MAG: hypothetical protein MET45_14050 [Nostoc sp. LLA-1]|nr:hypothetical protein [Cyanocohniella sp. LLY]